MSTDIDILLYADDLAILDNNGATTFYNILMYGYDTSQAQY